MKKLLLMLVLLTLALSALSSCSSSNNMQANKEPEKVLYEIPEGSIKYTHYTYGNVIDSGKRAIFFNFESDYEISKIEYSVTIYDRNKNEIITLENSRSFGSPSRNIEVAERFDANYFSSINSVVFTKIIGYTEQEIESDI